MCNIVAGFTKLVNHFLVEIYDPFCAIELCSAGVAEAVRVAYNSVRAVIAVDLEALNFYFFEAIICTVARVDKTYLHVLLLMFQCMCSIASIYLDVNQFPILKYEIFVDSTVVGIDATVALC